MASVKAISTSLDLALAATAAAQKGSMSAARTLAAPAFMAATATRPEPVARSMTRWPATSVG
ncbi:hypothetical protein D3C81_2170780 [compost metagenome]